LEALLSQRVKQSREPFFPRVNGLIFLNELGLGWIEDSVQDDIQLEALEEVTASDMPAGEFTSAAKLLQPSYRKTVRKSANFLVRKEYSQKERLTMLIDAIAAVCARRRVAQAVSS